MKLLTKLKIIQHLPFALVQGHTRAQRSYSGGYMSHVSGVRDLVPGARSVENVWHGSLWRTLRQLPWQWLRDESLSMPQPARACGP